MIDLSAAEKEKDDGVEVDILSEMEELLKQQGWYDVIMRKRLDCYTTVTHGKKKQKIGSGSALHAFPLQMNVQ